MVVTVLVPICVVAWMRMSPIGSDITTLGVRLVAVFGEVEEVQPC